jgi:hypothetical protein
VSDTAILLLNVTDELILERLKALEYRVKDLEAAHDPQEIVRKMQEYVARDGNGLNLPIHWSSPHD